MNGDANRDPDRDGASPKGDGADAASRAAEHIERGLELYGAGDLDGAVTEWEWALELDPKSDRAAEYVDYVRQNYESLTAQLETGAQPPVADELEVPFGIESFGEDGPAESLELPGDDEDPYDDLELDLGEPGAARPAPKPPAPRLDDLDEGWALEDEAAEPGTSARARDDEITVPGGEEPPPYGERDALSEDALAALGGLGGSEPPPLGAPPDETTAERSGAMAAGYGFDLDELDLVLPDDSGLDGASDGSAPIQVTFRTGGVQRMPADPVEEGALTVERHSTGSDSELTVERHSTGSDGEPTVERQSLGGGGPAAEHGAPPRPADEELTVERGAAWPQALDLGDPLDEGTGELELELGGPAGGDPDEPRAPTQDPYLASSDPGVIIDESLLLGEDATREHRAISAGDFPDDVTRERAAAEGAAPPTLLGEMVAHLRALLDQGAPLAEEAEERVRRQVTTLIEVAATESQQGNRPLAVAALGLALGEDPDSAVAQKIIHRHRDLVLAIYGAYLGDLDAVPALALPLHQLASEDLDSRAAFLLSRIDGTLTFEEILDVSGMTRLEALRHLCRMLLCGILEVR